MLDSKNSDINFTGKIMNEDIEMMSKEIEQIRDQILNGSDFKHTKNFNSAESKHTPRKMSVDKKMVKPL